MPIQGLRVILIQLPILLAQLLRIATLGILAQDKQLLPLERHYLEAQLRVVRLRVVRLLDMVFHATLPTTQRHCRNVPLILPRQE